MKTCPNCRVIHPDEYMGTCQDCGAPLGGVSANGSEQLRFQWARQVQSNVAETAAEENLKRGNYAGLKFDKKLLDVAKAGAYLLEQDAGRDVSDWEDDAA